MINCSEGHNLSSPHVERHQEYLQSRPSADEMWTTTDGHTMNCYFTYVMYVILVIYENLHISILNVHPSPEPWENSGLCNNQVHFAKRIRPLRRLFPPQAAQLRGAGGGDSQGQGQERLVWGWQNWVEPSGLHHSPGPSSVFIHSQRIHDVRTQCMHQFENNKEPR